MMTRAKSSEVTFKINTNIPTLSKFTTADAGLRIRFEAHKSNGKVIADWPSHPEKFPLSVNYLF